MVNVKPLGERKINDILKNVKNYLGSYSIDEISSVKISKYPVYLIINLDTRVNGGTHWIALAIYDNDVFICDSLGYLKPNQTFPEKLIKFLHVITFARNFHITRQLQPTYSTTCGYYAILFVYTLSLKRSLIELPVPAPVFPDAFLSF